MPVIVKEKAKEILDLYWLQKARNINVKNDNDSCDGVMQLNMEKNFKGTFCVCGKKGHGKQN